jgi:uncharacterized protein
MKKVWIILLSVLVALSSCNKAPKETSKETPKEAAEEVLKIGGEDCSVKVSNIEFTKSLNKAKDLAKVENGKLVFKAEAKTDNFRDPDGKLSNNSAAILLTKIDNTKPFTFTAKVTPDFKELYDAGVLYVYVHEKLWQKFCFERDEYKQPRIVSVRTINTSDDNNHDKINNATVYMKISSDTKSIGYYYSLDNKEWHFARLYKNDYPAEIWVGVSTQSPIGNGTTATFEDCSLTLSSIKDFRMGI